MGYKREIQILGMRVMGVQIQSQDPRWSDLSVLKDAYGADEVVAAFEDWISAEQHKPVPYPLAPFLRVAPGILKGKIHVVSRDPEFQGDLDKLCGDLYTVNNLQAFTGKERDALALLLKTYTAAEIKTSYIEYTANLDDFELKRAARTFSQGGATAVILSARKQKIELHKQDEMLERTRKKAAEQPMIPLEEEETDEELP